MPARSILALAIVLALPFPASADDHEARLTPVSFGTNWRAQAEHGGFYQALAKGYYEEAGLEVEIRQGGPGINHRALIAAGRLDFYMGGNLFGSFEFLQAGVPVVAVAALFQKEPAAFLAHPDSGVEGFEDLAGRTVFLSDANKLTVWPWLQAEYGLEDGQLKPYNFNSGPFLSDPGSVQQGYVTAEPYAIEQQAGWEPTTLLFADGGFDSYSTLIVARDELVDEQPEVVQAFVDASIRGWVDYLNGDPAPGDALIKEANPEMTPGQLAYSRDAMRELGIVESGDALKLGVGAMTPERWLGFYDKAVGWGAIEPGLEIERAFTTEFVNKGLGLDAEADG